MQNRDPYGAGRPRTGTGQQSGAGRPPANARPSGGSPTRRPAAPPPQRGGRPPQRPPKKEKPVRNRWFTAILMVLATLAGCLFLAVFILDVAQDLFGLNQEDQEIIFTVPPNATNRQVADLLGQQGVVDKNLIFYIYSGLKAEEGDFQAGDYIFNTNMGYDQIIVAMTSGSYIREEVRLTFIEGLTLYEIAQKLEDERVCNAQDFLDYLETEELDYEFMDRLPEGPLRMRRLEGYIFPDTYDFYVNEKVSSVAKKFLDTFDYRITDEMLERMNELNLSLDEAITLASVIQKEAGDPDEMRKVSSVFHNRLDNSQAFPQLQSDVTIFYVEQYIKPFVSVQNQEMYDAYNTYVCNGLPVGPICNPGLDAINAALNPMETNNYFFVTDVNNYYYYASTAEEHYRNVAFAESVEGEEGAQGEVHGTDTLR